jgi:predicted nucleic acid-binding protein
VFVDSGAWIALLSARDTHHADAERMFRVAVAQRIPMLTTNLVVAEVHRFILFRAGIRPAALAVARIDTSHATSIVFAGAQHHAAARRWLDQLSDQVISYTDAISFAVMQETHCSAVMSFDHDFVVAGFQLWQVERD